jgi:capsular exopolysaccharide synthesis family protein
MLNRSPGNGLSPSNGTPRAVIGVDGITPEGAAPNFGRYARVLRRRWRMGALVAGGFALLVVVLSVAQPKSYTTQLKLIAGSAPIDASSAETAGSQLPILNVLSMANGGIQTSETYASLLTDTPVVSEVISTLKLKMTPSELLAHVTVRPVTDTSIITLSVSARDREQSAAIANAFGDTFINHERDLIAHQADSALAFLQKQLPDAQERMRAADDALAAYQQRTGIADLPTQTQAYITSVASLEEKEREAELAKAQAESSLATVQSQLAASPQNVIGQQNVATNPVSSQLQQKISDLQVQLSGARRQYTDNFPTVIALKAQLAQAEQQLRQQPSQVLAGTESVPNPVYQQLQEQESTLVAQAASADSQIALLKQQLADARPAMDRLPEQSRRISSLQRDAKAAEGLYLALDQKYKDVFLSRTTAPSTVSVTSHADPSVFTVSPNLSVNIPIGVVIGLILGIATIFAAEYFDDRFRSEEDVKERLGLPVLATIPQMSELAEKTDPLVRPMTVEAFYQLVAALRFSSSHPPRTIAITSPDQGDGKSTIAVNTAISLSMLKARVLLVDGDLRRPSLHEKLNLPNDRGLSDVLVGLSKFPDCVQTTSHDGVWLLTSGRPAPNPVGLLQSAAFDRFLRRARERFDFIVIDGPALRSIVDGVILGLKADGTVLVVSAEKTRGRAVEGALAKLRSVGTINLLGVVLNGATLDPREHSEYYLGAGQSISLPTQSTE